MNYLLLTALLLFSLLLALASGPVALPPWQLLEAFQHAGFERTLLVDIRLPRLLLAVGCAVALTSSGAALQGLFRNPMADAGLLGVSGGAALGAVSVMVWHAPRPTLPVAAFVGGLLFAGVVWRLSQSPTHSGRQTDMTVLLLAGLAMNALSGAGVAFLTSMADDLALRELTFWLFGSFGKAGWSELAYTLPLMALAAFMISRQHRALDQLLLGEREAFHLGLDVETCKRKLLLWSVLASSAVVSVAGMIGFVGLLLPHLIRLWRGPKHRFVLLGGMLLGGSLLLLADWACRVWFAPQELPIGILTALLGAPFFLYLLVRRRAG